MNRKSGFYWIRIHKGLSTEWVVAKFIKEETDCNWYLPGTAGKIKEANLVEVDEKQIQR